MGRVALLILDGGTGQFLAALRVRDGDEAYIPNLNRQYPWMLGEERLYGVDFDKFWVIDLNDMSLLYSSVETLVLESVWSEVEQVLGPMPRE